MEAASLWLGMSVPLSLHRCPWTGLCIPENGQHKLLTTMPHVCLLAAPLTGPHVLPTVPPPWISPTPFLTPLPFQLGLQGSSSPHLLLLPERRSPLSFLRHPLTHNFVPIQPHLPWLFPFPWCSGLHLTVDLEVLGLWRGPGIGPASGKAPSTTLRPLSGSSGLPYCAHRLAALLSSPPTPMPNLVSPQTLARSALRGGPRSTSVASLLLPLVSHRPGAGRWTQGSCLQYDPSPVSGHCAQPLRTYWLPVNLLLCRLVC